MRDGEDARFSVELSASVQGEWFLNGTRLQSEESGRFSVQHCGTEHSLLIRSARLRESGARVTFVASSVRDSAILHVQGELTQHPTSQRAAGGKYLPRFLPHHVGSQPLRPALPQCPRHGGSGSCWQACHCCWSAR